MAHLRRLACLLFFFLPFLASSQPAVKAFITIADMVAANPYQVADPTPSGTRTATVTVQSPAGMYALTNTWSGTNTSTLIASSTPDWAWQLLSLASGPNLYTSDGTLNSPRVVNLDAKPLTWQGPGNMTNNVGGFVVNASDKVLLKPFGDLDLSPGLRLQLHLASVNSGASKDGYALTLVNAGTAEADFRPLPMGTNIYNTDGILTGARTVNLASLGLTFKGPGSVEFTGVNSLNGTANDYVRFESPGNVILESKGRISLRTPGVISGGAQAGQVLTLQANGSVEYAPTAAAGGSNIYNSDGILLANRIVDQTNFNLTFQGRGNFVLNDLNGADLRATNLTIQGKNNVNIKTPGVFGATIGQVLTLQDPTSGRVEYQTPPPPPTVNIYNADGTLAADRKVTGNSKSLNFTNINVFTASAEQAAIGGRLALALKTPGVAAKTATVGQFLRLNDTNGVVDFGTAPNIYNTDGTIVGDRIINLQPNRSVGFYGASTGEVFAVSGVGRATISSLTNNFYASGSSTLGASGRVALVTPSAGASATGKVLTYIDGAGSIIDAQPAQNIYSANGTLSGNRTLNGGGYSLTLEAILNFGLDGENTSLVGRKNLYLYTSNLFNGTAVAGQVLTLQPGGVVEYKTPATGLNIYNGDGTLTTNRTLSGGNFDLRMLGLDDFGVNANTVDLIGRNRLSIHTPGVETGTVNPGHVLTLKDKVTGATEFDPAPNLYSIDGTLTGPRTVNGGGTWLAFTNLPLFSARGQTSTLGGTMALNLRTPAVNAGTAVNGQVLRLTEKTNGTVEFATPAADVSIYTDNGSITGDRTVNVPLNRTLGFYGVNNNETFAVQNFTKGYFNAATSSFLSAGSTVLGASGRVQFVTPSAGAAATGKVLTYTDGAASIIDAMPVANLYNSNGVITGSRTVTVPSAMDLTISGAGRLVQTVPTNIHFAPNELVMAVTNTGKMYLKTPQVSAGTASTGWYLMLTNNSSGEVEFAPAPTPAGALNIYNSNGTLTGNRTLTGAGYNLNFYGPSKTTGLPADLVHFFGWDRFIMQARTNEAHGEMFYVNLTPGGKMVFATPRVKTLGAPAMAGQVLTLAADGTTDFQAVGTPGVDKNIYELDGVIGANRKVDVNAKTLTFTNSTLFLAQGVEAGLAASSKMYLKTPGYLTKNSQFLQMVNQTTGEVEFGTPTDTSIYSGNGNILGTRSVGLNNQSLTFNGPGTFNIFGATALALDTTSDLTLSGQGSIKLRTPKVIGGTGGIATGQVPILSNLDGTIEFGALPSSVNIYNQNGNLNSERSVGLAGFPLHFNGPGSVDFPLTTGTFAVSGAAATMDVTGALTLRSPTSIKIVTPKTTTASKPNVGDVLTFQASDGTVEFTPSGSFYSANGTLSSDRTVTGNTKNLTFAGLNDFALSGRDVNLTSSATLSLTATAGGLKFYTKNVQDGAAPIGSVFTAKDAAGVGEWSAPFNLYTANGTLTGNRTVTMSGRNLTFAASQPAGNSGSISFTLAPQTTGTPGSFNVSGGPVNFTMAGSAATYTMGGGNFGVTGATGATLSGTGTILLETGASGSMKIKTPKVAAGTAPSLGVLTLKNPTDGTVEFEPLQAGSGATVTYSCTLTTSGSGPVFSFTPSNIKPTMPLTGSGEPFPGTRMVAKLAGMGGYSNIGASTYIYWDPIPGADKLTYFVPPKDSNFASGDLVEGVYVDLVWVENWTNTGTGSHGAWVMINTDWANSGRVTMANLLAKTAAVPLAVTNLVTSRVTTYSFAGVVDTFADLAEIPLTFKKVSTLGRSSIGDGQHADYYLTAFIPETLNSIRSTVDPTRMWKKLVSIP